MLLYCSQRNYPPFEIVSRLKAVTSRSRSKRIPTRVNSSVFLGSQLLTFPLSTDIVVKAFNGFLECENVGLTGNLPLPQDELEGLTHYRKSLKKTNKPTTSEHSKSPQIDQAVFNKLFIPEQRKDCTKEQKSRQITVQGPALAFLEFFIANHIQRNPMMFVEVPDLQEAYLWFLYSCESLQSEISQYNTFEEFKTFVESAKKPPKWYIPKRKLGSALIRYLELKDPTLKIKKRRAKHVHYLGIGLSN